MTGFFIVFALLFTTAGVLLVFISKKTIAKADVYMLEQNSFKAIVLDVHREKINTARGKKLKKAVILQFRDESGRKTIVHKYTGITLRRYSRGDKVDLFFNEDNDTALIDKDNGYVIMSRTAFCGALLMFTAAVGMIICYVLL